RPEALERYTRSHERSVLPRLVRPRVTRAAWLLSFLIMAGAAAGATALVPEFVSAPAVIRRDDPRRAVLLIFLPPTQAHQVTPGAQIVASGDEAGGGWTVREVETGLLSPASALAIGAVVLPDAARHGPTVLARAVPAPGARALASASDGMVFSVRIRTGERRVISLLLPRWVRR
ncbi:MAG TPA: hypothetical protein VE913_19405, partial [Longimicrobium sp.]|nr:hypothetical protein [Longimicrobium sp.]